MLNAFALGVGYTAMSFALRTGLIPVTVPKVVRVEVEGAAHGVLSPKDLILHLIGMPYFREEHWRTAPTDTCGRVQIAALHNCHTLEHDLSITSHQLAIHPYIHPSVAVAHRLSRDGPCTFCHLPL